MNKICVNCKTEFFTKNKKENSKKYCSVSCFRNHFSVKGKIDLICKTCGNSFTRRKIHTENIENFYCSRKCFKGRKIVCSINWKSIQHYYNNNVCNYTQLQNKFNISRNDIEKAKSEKLFVPRTLSAAVKNSKLGKNLSLSTKTKEKISQSRRKYLEENPDKVPYLLNHSSKKSYPEEIFEKALIENGIVNYIYNYQNGIYQYDFAFVDIKLDVEIDGGTHLTEKVMAIDKRRDEWSKSQGWKILRFTAKEVKNDVSKCIEKLKLFYLDC